MYVEVHKYYLCIKFDIVFKISLIVSFDHPSLFNFIKGFVEKSSP